MRNWLKRWQFVDGAVQRLVAWAAFVTIVAAAFGAAVAGMSWVTNSIAALASYGWGVPVLVAIGIVLVIVVALSFAAVPAARAWRTFYPIKAVRITDSDTKTATPASDGDELAIIRGQIDEVNANAAQARRDIVTTMSNLALDTNRDLKATNEKIETLANLISHQDKSFATRIDLLIRALRARDAKRDVLLPNDKVAMSLGKPLVEAKSDTYPDAASWLSDYQRWNDAMHAIDYLMGQWAKGVSPLFDLKERHYKNSPMPPENIKTDDTIIPFKTVWHVQSSYSNQRDGLFAFLNEKAIFPG
jgi:hypothetical protein